MAGRPPCFPPVDLLALRPAIRVPRFPSSRRFGDRCMAIPHPPFRPRRAMVLAAGLGIRMRPLTARMPKPLIEVGGKALIDHALDRLATAEVELAVVNIHHFADQMRRHLASRRRPKIVVS